MARSRKQDVTAVEQSRNYTAKGIAALLAPVVRPAFRKRAPAAAALLTDWAALAGPELTVLATPVKFAGGTLTLACSGPVAMALQHTAPQVISRLNVGLGQAMVERLRFVQQTPGVAAQEAMKVEYMVKAAPGNLPEGELGEALARLYQGVKTIG